MEKDKIKEFVRRFLWLSVLNITGEDMPKEKQKQWEINFEEYWKNNFSED